METVIRLNVVLNDTLLLVLLEGREVNGNPI